MKPLASGIVPLLLAASAFAANQGGEGADTVTVYRHVGADGVVAFSDRASAGAQAIELPVSSPRADDLERADRTLRQQLDVIDVLERSRRADATERAEQRRLDIEYARIDAAREAAEAAMSDAYDDYPHFLYAPWYGPVYPWRPHLGWSGGCRPGFGACAHAGLHGAGGVADRPPPRAPRPMQVKLL